MPDDTPDDEVEDRVRANAARFGIDLAAPTSTFSDRVDEAMVHGAESARLDPQSAIRPWYPIGPRNVGGRVAAMAQDPLTPRTFYAGTSFGGLWKTEDGGDTWRPLSVLLESDSDAAVDDKDVAVPIGAIGICHRSPQTLYVGTGELRSSAFTGTGLWMSTDGAQTFTRIANVNSGPLQALGYERIEVDPWTPGRCWIACHRGLFRREPTIAAPGPNVVQDTIDAANAPASQSVTDVVIDFGDRTRPAPPGPFTIYVGMHGAAAANPGGIFRAVFDPTTNAYRRSDPANPASPIWTRLTDPDLPFPVAQPAGAQPTGRVKLALCEKSPLNLIAVVGLQDGKPSRIFRSTDGGNSWSPTAERTQERSTISWYALMLACHPEDPRIFFTGSTDIFRTVDGGQSWDKVLDFDKYEAGERAQHADQHDFFFDRRDPRRVWAANDGGISESRNLGLTWRKRSHGISASQFYDLAIHPTFPYIMAGGLQDNGCWITYGGLSWYVCGRADGGAVALQAGATDVFIASHQGNTTRVEAQLTFLTTLTPPKGTFGWKGNGDLLGNWLADRPTSTDAGGQKTYPYLVMNAQNFLPGVQAAHRGTIFGRKLEGHPVAPDSFISGWIGAAYNVASGTLGAVPPAAPTMTLGRLSTGAFTPANAQVSAVSFAPTLPARAPSPNSDNVWWIGTNRGEVFFTPDAGANWINATARLTAAGHLGSEITGIAIHARDTSIAVVTTAAAASNVFLSFDALAVTAGAASSTWRAVSHASPAPAGTDPRLDLPAAAIGRAVIDPQGPVTGAADMRQTIYAATLSGVYVCRNASTAPAEAPLWRTFNAGMPLVLVTDLDYGESYAGDGTTVVRRYLRAGSFGRGLWECDLDRPPASRLLIRSTTIDDGFRYFGTQSITHDPRLNTPGSAAVPLDRARAIDIRIDPPPYSFFGDVLDPVEFDEDLRSGTLVTGERNFIYVQLQNRGPTELSGAVVAPLLRGRTRHPAGGARAGRGLLDQVPERARRRLDLAPRRPGARRSPPLGPTPRRPVRVGAADRPRLQRGAARGGQRAGRRPRPRHRDAADGGAAGRQRHDPDRRRAAHRPAHHPGAADGARRLRARRSRRQRRPWSDRLGRPQRRHRDQPVDGRRPGHGLRLDRRRTRRRPHSRQRGQPRLRPRLQSLRSAADRDGRPVLRADGRRGRPDRLGAHRRTAAGRRHPGAREQVQPRVYLGRRRHPRPRPVVIGQGSRPDRADRHGRRPRAGPSRHQHTRCLLGVLPRRREREQRLLPRGPLRSRRESSDGSRWRWDGCRPSPTAMLTKQEDDRNLAQAAAA